jgi:hypothetical protein
VVRRKLPGTMRRYPILVTRLAFSSLGINPDTIFVNSAARDRSPVVRRGRFAGLNTGERI